MVTVAAELEPEGLLSGGGTAFLRYWVRVSERTRDYRGEYPVVELVLAYREEDGDEFCSLG